MKYYYREHIAGYQQIKAEGKTAWNEIHGGVGFENFSSRIFLETTLPHLQFSVPDPVVLEYGCGTGPGACFLAERRFQVNGIDIIPTAIEMARELATERGLNIRYEVQDICELPHKGKKYDMIVDSYCLQCIVTDEDREKVFSAVRARLKPGGYYLISTAMFDEERFCEEERILDEKTGKVYHRYGADDLFDAKTGIVYCKIEGLAEYKDAVNVGREWYMPYRRHRKARALKAELEAAAFTLLYQDEQYGGNVVCVQRSGAG